MKKFVLLLALILCTGIIAMSQPRVVVKGYVSDSDGPLPGVCVYIQGTSTGTRTDFDGFYSIACNIGQTLVYSCIGYQDRAFRITYQTEIDVYMDIDEDEIVIITPTGVSDMIAMSSLPEERPSKWFFRPWKYYYDV